MNAYTRYSGAIRVGALMACSAITSITAAAQRPTLSPNVRQYVSIDTPTVVLAHVRVIDGTGAPPREDQTVVVRDGRITALGDAASIQPPAGAQVLDLTGKTVIPGLVMMHEHLYYPSGSATYSNLSESFTRLYLAGGVTSMRTAGNSNGYGEINIANEIRRGEKPGPWIDATAPYLTGPGLDITQFYELKDAADATRVTSFWADAGATSFKAYMTITRAELAAAIKEAHRRGLKITGHLCSVTYHEAAALGIDDLEHGFFVSTDFAPGKKPDVCPGQKPGMTALAATEPDGAAFKSLVADLVAHHVALTSTLTIFETFAPGRPEPPGLDVLDPILKDDFQKFRASLEEKKDPFYADLLAKARKMEVQFVRAGGLLLAGTDPTGSGGVIPGYSDQRQLELLVESGFTPLEAIKICTLNGATYLGKTRDIGSIAVGKQADLVVIDGNPAANVADIRKVETVFKQGVGYDPAKLIASVKGKVGLF